MASVSADTIDRSIAPASCERDNIELRPELSLLRATFSDKATEERFIQHLIEEGFAREKLMQVLGSFIFMAYGFLDVLVVGNLSREFLTIRFLIAAPIALGIVYLSWTKPLRRHFGLATSLGLLIYALAIVYMVYRLPGPGAPPYIIGVLVVLIFTSCLMRINFLYAGPTYALIAILYCVALISKSDAAVEEIVSGYFFMISVTLVAITTIYMQERQARETWITAEFKARDDAVIRHLLLEATAADRSKTNFLSIVTHELRTPLHQIIGFSEVIRNQPDIEEAPKYLDQVIFSANELLKKLGKMLRYADAAAGKLQIEIEECSVTDIVDRAREETRKAALARSISVNIEGVKGANLLADPHHAVYAVQNIIENAITASKPGSTVTIYGTENREGGYSLHVKDTGVGMTAEQIRNAFQAFAQAEAGLARYREGLGLGLPIANRLLTAQNAYLSISSTHGVGTDVEITFKKVSPKTCSDKDSDAA